MVRRGIAAVVVLCGVLLVCGNSYAQEPQQDRRFGLTVGYPGSGGVIGLVWQTSDRTALRPEFSFTSRFAGANTTGDSSQVGVTVTVIRYIAMKGPVTAYLGPRLSYSRSSSTGTTSPSGLSVTSAGSVYGAGAAIGLQYELTRKIAAYGEVGAGYSYLRSSTSGAVVSPTSTSHAIGSRGSLGLNLYF